MHARLYSYVQQKRKRSTMHVPRTRRVPISGFCTAHVHAYIYVLYITFGSRTCALRTLCAFAELGSFTKGLLSDERETILVSFHIRYMHVLADVSAISSKIESIHEIDRTINAVETVERVWPTVICIHCHTHTHTRTFDSVGSADP